MQTSKLYFFCPDENSPIGGIKVLYKHVDILNNNNIESYILHVKKGFRCSWFENNTKIVYYSNIQIHDNDILVFPEVVIHFFDKQNNKKGISRFIKRNFSGHRYRHFVYDLSILPNRKVIFNQNAYYTFNFFSWKTQIENPYKRDDIKAIVCVSDDNKEYFNIAFPWLNVYRVRLSVETSIFNYEPEKEKSICFLLNKGKNDLNQILNILKLNNIVDGYTIKTIDCMSEKEVASVLQKSSIFLSFNITEGFSLPPFEAAICGCIVIGYHGRAAREYMQNSFSYPVEIGDIQGFIKSVSEVLQLQQKNPELIKQKRELASEYMLKHYNKEIESNDVINTWKKILEL